MNYYTRPVELADWESLCKMVRFISLSPKFSKILAVDEAKMEVALVNSRLPDKMSPIRLQVVHSASKVVGYAIIYICQPPATDIPGCLIGPSQCFIHSMFVYPDAGKEAGLVLIQGIEEFGKSFGAKLLYGNVRMDGHFGAIKRKYGMKPLYIAIGKEIE